MCSITLPRVNESQFFWEVENDGFGPAVQFFDPVSAQALQTINNALNQHFRGRGTGCDSHRLNPRQPFRTQIVGLID